MGEQESTMMERAHEERAMSKRFRAEAKSFDEGSSSYTGRRELAATAKALADSDKLTAKRRRQDGK
jgi:hypothetical protein